MILWPMTQHTMRLNIYLSLGIDVDGVKSLVVVRERESQVTCLKYLDRHSSLVAL